MSWMLRNCPVLLETGGCYTDSGLLAVAPGMLARQSQPPWANIAELLRTALARSHEPPHGHSRRGVADDEDALDISTHCARLQHPAWRYLRCRRELEGYALGTKQEIDLAMLA